VVTQITKSSDDRLERIRSYTDNWVIFGSDTILMASKKDGSSGEPIIVAETTQTKGYKYVTKYGLSDNFICNI